MASKKAKAFLATMGISLVHNKTELGNFAAGTGNGKHSMPYHVIRMDDRYGDSKKTVGWHATLASARAEVRNLRIAHDGAAGESRQCGAEYMRRRNFQYYIRDIRNGAIYK